MKDKEIKQKWIEALRSGKYKQGRGSLCYIDRGKPKYWCIGALEKILGNEDSVLIGFGMPEELVSFDDNDNIINSNSRSYSLLETSQFSTLVELNDGFKVHDKPPHSFEEISEWIDKNL